MPSTIKQTPFKVLTHLLYGGACLTDREDGLLIADRPNLARHLRTTPARLREHFQWLHEHQYIEILGNTKGRTLLRIRPPQRGLK